eukprot:TRINITY_DN6850_c0_g1_i3.p1 TRINITY_DN6850_c0_g1~~TRINITY_DN6850_c0_g1_i3.p1  ORF type:complete len:347 (-),score=52.61 TRINITY_DN6850_c0_g1_i3:62-1102(-)
MGNSHFEPSKALAQIFVRRALIEFALKLNEEDLQEIGLDENIIAEVHKALAEAKACYKHLKTDPEMTEKLQNGLPRDMIECLVLDLYQVLPNFKRTMKDVVDQIALFGLCKEKYSLPAQSHDQITDLISLFKQKDDHPEPEPQRSYDNLSAMGHSYASSSGILLKPPTSNHPTGGANKLNARNEESKGNESIAIKVISQEVLQESSLLLQPSEAQKFAEFVETQINAKDELVLDTFESIGSLGYKMTIFPQVDVRVAKLSLKLSCQTWENNDNLREGFRTIFERLQSQLISLSLLLNHSDIGGENFAELIAHVSKCSKLRELSLYLRGTQLADKNMMSLMLSLIHI